MEKVFISEMDQYYFGEGIHYEIYKKLGAHLSTQDGKDGVYFAVWAPHAQYVSVVGDFNEWQTDAHPMERLEPLGIWQIFVPEVKKGALYKYFVIGSKGQGIYKSDPYGNEAELRPGTASKVTDITGYKWGDKKWMSDRMKKDVQKSPMAIYECHIGSWMRHPVPEAEGFYNYRLFADRLIEYLKEMNYTHVELMGIAEYPYDGSWGYQVTGYYAPTSRYGTPEDFMYLVDSLHKAKIGVILDWVPAHFPRDVHGLADFDGEPLYEYADPRKGEHPDWGTKIFDYEKSEVKNFLIANALFWLTEFHVDGLRVDAVASMLYLDYGKNSGQWVANKYGENKNLEAIEFFKHLNSIIRTRVPGAITIAEESTAWPKVTASPEDNGLGFTFKWNMGWMHDFCDYMKLDPFFRKGSHYKMTFAMSYNGAENYILVLSHDEVVHLKCSMLNKMPGFEVDKFANLRAGYTFMFGHCGKKLLFMGQDFAQKREWSEERELDWFLLGEDLHKGMHDYVAKLLKIYNKYPCLYENDNNNNGFEWINADDTQNSIYTFFRKSENGKDNLLFIINFTPMERNEFRVGVPQNTKYKLLLSSDDKCFGGNGKELPKTYKAEEIPWDNRPWSVNVPLAPYGAVVLKF
ncbi:MAG: 1,4-alpha-glucan branching protein GlgB [Lachnospiraceae bacterium]|nr:1,4-alpha-glucan branching protein GlgB [Lachnospiraceae bacterium]